MTTFETKPGHTVDDGKGFGGGKRFEYDPESGKMIEMEGDINLMSDESKVEDLNGY